MQLWLKWFKCVLVFKEACSRTKTFAWVIFALIGLSSLPDLRGVTGLARAGFLSQNLFQNFLNLFKSRGLPVHKLTELWIQLATKLFQPTLYHGRPVLLLEGLKIQKEGSPVLSRRAFLSKMEPALSPCATFQSQSWGATVRLSSQWVSGPSPFPVLDSLLGGRIIPRCPGRR